MRTILRSLFSLAVACVAMGGSGALRAQDLVQTTDRDGGAFLVRSADGWKVHRSDAAPLVVPLPPRLVAYRFESVAGGWVVAGTVADGSRADLLVARIDDEGVEILPPPSDRFGFVRTNPVPFVESGLLTGLTWIEGHRHDAMSVLAAEWLGDRWGAVETVSPPGPGTQIALGGTVLDDGRWLALWSGFDGEDDEILWSRRSRDGWTAPRRLNADNAVPDITPSVIATRSGALAAWSVYDGEDYRLGLARLDGEAWRLEPPSGARGSLYPQALRADDRILVLHSTVIPEGWSILELDAEGERIRLLHAASSISERPAVLPRLGDVPVLVWSTDRRERRAVPLVVESSGER